MNVLIGGVLLLLCSLVGFRVAASYRKKLNFVQDFKSFLDILETNIMFTQDEITKLLDSKQDTFHKEFKEFLIKYKENIHTPSDFLSKWAQEQNLVSKDTAELIINFMQGLGHIDSSAQLQAIKQTNEILSTHILKVQDEQKKGTMSARLGIMGGLALFIIVL